MKPFYARRRSRPFNIVASKIATWRELLAFAEDVTGKDSDSCRRVRENADRVGGLDGPFGDKSVAIYEGAGRGVHVIGEDYFADEFEAESSVCEGMSFSDCSMLDISLMIIGAMLLNPEATKTAKAARFGTRDVFRDKDAFIVERIFAEWDEHGEKSTTAGIVARATLDDAHTKHFIDQDYFLDLADRAVRTEQVAGCIVALRKAKRGNLAG